MKIYDRVKIKKTGVTGIIVDIRQTSGAVYTVEGDAKDTSGGYPLFDCKQDDLEILI